MKVPQQEGRPIRCCRCGAVEHALRVKALKVVAAGGPRATVPPLLLPVLLGDRHAAAAAHDGPVGVTADDARSGREQHRGLLRGYQLYAVRAQGVRTLPVGLWHPRGQQRGPARRFGPPHIGTRPQHPVVRVRDAARSRLATQQLVRRLDLRGLNDHGGRMLEPSALVAARARLVEASCRRRAVKVQHAPRDRTVRPSSSRRCGAQRVEGPEQLGTTRVAKCRGLRASRPRGPFVVEAHRGEYIARRAQAVGERLDDVCAERTVHRRQHKGARRSVQQHRSTPPATGRGVSASRRIQGVQPRTERLGVDDAIAIHEQVAIGVPTAFCGAVAAN